MKGFGVVQALGIVLCADHAAPQSPTAFQLRYGTSPGCPTAAEFAARVEAHTPIARLAAPGERALELRVTTEVNGRGSQGKLVIVGLDGSSSERTVAGRDCREVVDALALVAAIVIDPNARVAVGEPKSDTGASQDPAATAAGQTTAAVIAPEPKPAPEPTREPRPPPARPPPAPPPRPADPAPAQSEAAGDPPWRAGPSFQAGLVGPGLTPNGGIAVLYGIEAALERDALLAPSLRLSGYNLQGNEVVTPYGKARFEWTLLRLSVCPVRWSIALFALRPCALGDVGRLRGVGYETTAPEEHTSLWVALGAAARAEIRAYRVLAIELEAGASFPLSNERFFFDPGTDAYEVNPGFYGLLGIGLRFP